MKIDVPRTPKLTKKNGYWCTKAGAPNGKYFGKVSEMSYSAAKTRFCNFHVGSQLIADLPADKIQASDFFSFSID